MFCSDKIAVFYEYLSLGAAALDDPPSDYAVIFPPLFQAYAYIYAYYAATRAYV